MDICIFFQFEPIKNKAAMMIHGQIFVWAYIFIYLGQIHRSGIAGYNRYIINSLRNCQTISKWQYGFSWPPAVRDRFNCSKDLISIWYGQS